MRIRRENYCILISILCLLTLNTTAQTKKFALSTNVVNLVLGGPSLALGYQLNPRFGLQISGSTGELKFLPFTEIYKFKTVTLDLKYSFWEYLYIGPYVRYTEKHIKTDDLFLGSTLFERDFYGNGISSGMNLGIAFIDLKKINLELFWGAGLGGYITQIDYNSPDRKSKGFIDLRTGFLVGYKF